MTPADVNDKTKAKAKIMAKTLYHSALAKMGPVEVTVKSDGAIPSKFKDKPPFVVLEVPVPRPRGTWKKEQREMAFRARCQHEHLAPETRQVGRKLKFSDRTYVRDQNGSLRLLGPNIKTQP